MSRHGSQIVFVHGAAEIIDLHRPRHSSSSHIRTSEFRYVIVRLMKHVLAIAIKTVHFSMSLPSSVLFLQHPKSYKRNINFLLGHDLACYSPQRAVFFQQHEHLRGAEKSKSKLNHDK